VRLTSTGARSAYHIGIEPNIRGRTVTLKVKFADFQQITRSRAEAAPIELSDFEHLAAHLARLFAAVAEGNRLCGVTPSSLGDVLPPGSTSTAVQAALGPDPKDPPPAATCPHHRSCGSISRTIRETSSSYSSAARL